MATQMQNHLRKYVEDGIQQKVRLNNLILGYKNQEFKTRERIIDEKELENKVIAQGISQQKIDLITERRLKDEQIFANVQEIIGQSQEEMEGITLRMNAHLEELTEIEIVAGGFMTHAIGVDKGVTFDRNTMSIKFEPEGHVEIPIAARLNKWKDSSQLTINKIKKAGV